MVEYSEENDNQNISGVRSCRRFFTADWHLNSTLLIDKKLRQFRSAERMNDVIIANANKYASQDDIIIHVGDFCCTGYDQGYKSLDIKPIQLLDRINATFVNIKGNHDVNNNVKSICTSLRTSIGKFQNVSISHYPSYFQEARGTFKPGDLHICGHVHGQWKYFIDHKNEVLNINVGVDVWRNKIVSEEELFLYAMTIMRKEIK